MIEVKTEGTLYSGTMRVNVKYMSDGSVVSEVFQHDGTMKEIPLTQEELEAVERAVGEKQIKRFPLLMFWKACKAGTHKWGQNYR